MIPLGGITPFTLQDFPGHTACVVWFSGCNLRCQYCHNPELVCQAQGTYQVLELFEFLEKRKGKLEGVVFTGGEASLHPNIVDLARKVKEMGYKLKLDTNGLNPHKVEQLLAENLLDFIAIDYKAPPQKFKIVTGRDKYEIFGQTLDILCKQKVPFEVRTTVHTNLLDENDVQWIMDDLKRRKCPAPYYVQNYTHTDTVGHLSEQEKELDLSALTLNYEPRNFANPPKRPRACEPFVKE